MKKLNYKNRFKAVWDLVFYPKRFEKAIEKKINTERIKEKIKLGVNFKSKLDLLLSKKDAKIINRNFGKISAIQVPIYQDLPVNIYSDAFPGDSHSRSIEKRVERLQVSISQSELSAIDIKRYAADNIAKTIVELGFLKSVRRGPYIDFYIEYIK